MDTHRIWHFKLILTFYFYFINCFHPLETIQFFTFYIVFIPQKLFSSLLYPLFSYLRNYLVLYFIHCVYTLATIQFFPLSIVFIPQKLFSSLLYPLSSYLRNYLFLSFIHCFHTLETIQVFTLSIVFINTLATIQFLLVPLFSYLITIQFFAFTSFFIPQKLFSSLLYPLCSYLRNYLVLSFIHCVHTLETIQFFP